MRKLSFIFAFCSLFCCMCSSIFAAEYNAALVADMDTGRVLFKDKADDLNYPASLTKIMTLYLTFDALEHGRLKLDDYLIVSNSAAAAAPVKLGLTAGTKISVDNAIQAVAVHSANDVARVLAENLQGGKEKSFASLMTDVAREIGLSKTNFENASGLPDEDHLSSARDLALLSMAVYRHFPQYWHYFGQKTFTFNGKTYTNGNRLLGTYLGADGMKTGFTNSAKYCLVATASRGGHHVISVVLGAPNKDVRADVSRRMLDKGFQIMGVSAVAKDVPALSNPKPVESDVADLSYGKTGIQFGAFGSKASAEIQQKNVKNLLHVDTVLEQYNGMWRVRARNLSESAAQTLKKEAASKSIDSYIFY